MSLRLLEQEKEAALKPSPSLKLYPITAYAGSAKVEGQPPGESAHSCSGSAGR